MIFSRSTNIMLALLAACALWADYLVVRSDAIELQATCSVELSLNKSGDLVCGDGVSTRFVMSQK
jgi:hypothetical protein